MSRGTMGVTTSSPLRACVGGVCRVGTTRGTATVGGGVFNRRQKRARHGCATEAACVGNSAEPRTQTSRWRLRGPLRTRRTRWCDFATKASGFSVPGEDGESKSAALGPGPGAKKQLEETIVPENQNLPRGTVNGVRWASGRVLTLDKHVPGWWRFPHHLRSDDLAKRRNSITSRKMFDGCDATFDASFATADWQTFLRDDELKVPTQVPPQLLSIAPMMEYTTPHFRHLVRLLTKKTWLYTEMEVDQTLFHTDHPRLDRFLDFPLQGHPTVLQLGGSDPELLAVASAVAAPYGYDELNLNCGCPSPKVAGKGNFGASLMYDARLVGECVSAMAENSGGATVTVKCRIGVDDFSSYDTLCHFVETVATQMKSCASAGNKPLFAIHARKALLNGLSPAENRTVPPLRYDWVFGLAKDFPHIAFVLNGGVNDLETAKAVALGHGVPGARDWLDSGDFRNRTNDSSSPRLLGTMIGRQAHADPWGLLATVDTDVYGEPENPSTSASRRKLLHAYGEYCDATRGRFGTTKDGHNIPSTRHLVHPIQNLFFGEPNAKRWRRAMDDALKKDSKNDSVSVSELIFQTLKDGEVSDETLDAPPSMRWRRQPNGMVMGDDEFEDYKHARYATAVRALANLPKPPTRGDGTLG